LSDRPPQISVVIGTPQGWPAVRVALEPLLEQAAAHDAELIVADGSGRGRPDGLGRKVVWLERPGASVFQLYDAGLRRARGVFVALTEDHCAPSPDWLASILRAFDDHPDAAGIGGAVRNGSPQTLVDWASYLITKGAYISPLAARPRQITTESNLAYRRAALDGLDDHDGLGAMILLHNEALRASGAVLVCDDRMVVAHHQSFPLPKTSAIHFHDGRVIAGFSRARMGRRDRLRLGLWPVLPLFRAVRAVATALAKGQDPALVVRAVPYVLWLQYCHAMGTALGYLTGVGRSAHRLR
jgi:hypothetical protein